MDAAGEPQACPTCGHRMRWRSPVGPTAHRVLQVYLASADELGKLEPELGCGQIATLLHVQPATVQRARRELEKEGLLIRVTAGGGRRAAVFRLP